MYHLKPKLLPFLGLGLGGLGLVLCSWLYGAGYDETGLLRRDHIAYYFLWVTVVTVPAVLFWQTRQLPGKMRCSSCFPASVPGAVGCWAAAAGLLMTAFTDLMFRPDGLTVVSGVLGLLCFPALLLAGWSRLKGRRVSFVLHLAVCLHLTLRLLCQYRQWSGDPQLTDYCFRLLAGMSLMLFAYHRAAFDVNMGHYRAYVFTGLCALFFCCLSVPTGGQKLFFVTMGAWAATNLGAFPRRREREEKTDVPA